MSNMSRTFIVCILVLVFANYCVINVGGNSVRSTLYGSPDLEEGPNQNTYEFNIDENEDSLSTPNFTARNLNIITKVFHPGNGHKSLILRFIGDEDDVVVCLAYNKSPTKPSHVFISYDFGDTYENKTELFRLFDGNYSNVDSLFIHPEFKTHIVFCDTFNNVIFVTKDHGRNIKRIEVKFTPSEVSFYQFEDETFIVLDKDNDKLWITEDFGNSWRMIQHQVKSYLWLPHQQPNNQLLLVIETYELNGLALYSNDLFKNNVSVNAVNFNDLIVRGNYIFYTRQTKTDYYDLYVSKKLGKTLKCVFKNNLSSNLGYYVVDVADNKILVAVSETDYAQHLYVSENVDEENNVLYFTLTLQDVLGYFPNIGWKNSWSRNVKYPFVDVYKVEGISGIYIASQVIKKPFELDLNPQDVRSLITHDYGNEWRPITAPFYDNKNNTIECIRQNNCSLHLYQRFNQLHARTKSLGILSSKNAPGVLIATGVIGRTLEGKPSVYVSADAGYTWRQALQDEHLYGMGNYGNLLIAVRHAKNTGRTRHVFYSNDHGRNWEEATLNKSVRIFNLFPTPGRDTSSFIMFASNTVEDELSIIKIDLQPVANRNCPMDHKTWLGQHTYLPWHVAKQIAHQISTLNAHCINAVNENIINTRCTCTMTDYICDNGFIPTGEPFHCIRDRTTPSNPYDVPAACKPGKFYNRTKGYRKVCTGSCDPTFEDQYRPDLIGCPSEETDEFLLVGLRKGMGIFNFTTSSLEFLSIPTHLVVGLAMDVRSKCVYSSVSGSDFPPISTYCFDDGKVRTLVDVGKNNVEGIAYDWVSHNLYFVDTTDAKIELIKVDSVDRMRKVILRKPILKKPRGVAVHPMAGYLFWTDWDSISPSIGRSNLDGSNVLTLFNATYVMWPNGITIDFIAERIYWVDARYDYIGSSDLHGQRFQKIVENNIYVKHPFGVGVFNDEVYWTDWTQRGLYSTFKDGNGQTKTLILDNGTTGNVFIFGHGVQEGTNLCSIANCSDICVSGPNRTYNCLSPDIRTDNKTDGGLEKECKINEFKCSIGECIPKTWVCDDDVDCRSGLDELQCEKKTCKPEEFTCSDGKCIPNIWRCDGQIDCAGRNDEMNCTKLKCFSDQFSCGKSCIPLTFVCDGHVDCPGGNDEINCSYSTPATSSTTEPTPDWMFTCINGKKIPLWWKCDDADDCGDNSDELDCNLTSPSPRITTTSTTAATATETVTNASCGYNSFRCNSGTCIPISWKCDSQFDCLNGEDEKDCKEGSSLSATAGVFRCIDGTDIPYWWRCDGEQDCKDNSDESDCNINSPSPTITTDTTTTTTTTAAAVTESVANSSCGSNSFRCNSGKCIPLTWKCDNESDCLDGDDEINCGFSTYSNSSSTTTENGTCNEFKCANRKCIPYSQKCDNVDDCGDNSDETDCIELTSKLDNACKEHEFRCNPGECVPLQWVCDGLIDCSNATEKAPCHLTTVSPHTTVNYKLMECHSTEFKCFNGKCIPKQWRCDDTDDCGDNSDEIRCDEYVTIPPTYNITSTNGTGNCSKEEFRCKNGSCISIVFVCDGFEDCSDASDEMFCTKSDVMYQSNATCPLGYFQCDGNACRAFTLFCNGVLDCLDEYDEKNCNSTTQGLEMDVEKTSDDPNSLLLHWRVSNASNVDLEFLPSITSVVSNDFQNKTWTEHFDYRFTDLLPSTDYNMTVYARLKNTTVAFPPAKYVVAKTADIASQV